MAPIALYVHTQDFAGLQPVAIQLYQNPERQVYLAIDGQQPGNKYQWLMAKIFLQAADLNLNQVLNHLAFTHLIEEGFAVATHRRLAWQHPLYILLTKHFTALLVINELGVLTLINQTGIIQQYYQQLTTTVRDQIVAQNQKRAEQAGLLVYTYFLPENIPNSTSV